MYTAWCIVFLALLAYNQMINVRCLQFFFVVVQRETRIQTRQKKKIPRKKTNSPDLNEIQFCVAYGLILFRYLIANNFSAKLVNYFIH